MYSLGIASCACARNAGALDQPGIDDALNGRSTRSFIDEGAWARALAQHGDSYLIQFGHDATGHKSCGIEGKLHSARVYTRVFLVQRQAG